MYLPSSTRLSAPAHCSPQWGSNAQYLPDSRAPSIASIIGKNQNIGITMPDQPYLMGNIYLLASSTSAITSNWCDIVTVTDADMRHCSKTPERTAEVAFKPLSGVSYNIHKWPLNVSAVFLLVQFSPVSPC